MADAPKQSGKGPDFETALEQIESIIEKIESGEIGLEASLTEYGRGAELIRRCRQILSSAEQQVDDLTKAMLSLEEEPEPPLDQTE